MLLLQREIPGTKTVYSKVLITRKTKQNKKIIKKKVLSLQNFADNHRNTLLEHNKSKTFFALIHNNDRQNKQSNFSSKEIGTQNVASASPSIILTPNLNEVHKECSTKLR